LSPNLRELLEARVLIGDGAVGTLLGERGVGHPYARANLSHPEMVTDIHVEYLRAGADAIETNTFAANRFKLETHDLQERVRKVNAEGANLARKAARAIAGTGDRALVLGAIGPLGRPLAPVGPVSPDGAKSVFLEQAEALLEGGADVILLETFTDLSELRLAYDAVEVAQNLLAEAQPLIGGAYIVPPASAPDLAGEVLEAIGSPAGR
jgi:methionine synthase / methylenetetrahydrofolate reductase(NADPH)